ncbi:hypothetical protein NE865_12323 [Phthorimaea operculella]|nr:hypothetical protein NE865_12323 [Phthorimaea operculella]
MAQKDIQLVLDTQRRLEKALLDKMDTFNENLKAAAGNSNKDTIAKVRSDFNSFKDIVFETFNVLRDQIAAIHRSVEGIEMRQRRKCLIFNGVAEGGSNENTQSMTLDIINRQLGLPDVSAGSIKACHRLGGLRQDGARPILVRFTELSTKASIWKAKTKLKGTKVSVAEFLTHTRQNIFIKARKHFGTRQCWSMDGNINIKLPDGEKIVIQSLDELDTLIKKFPTPVQQQHLRGGATGSTN